MLDYKGLPSYQGAKLCVRNISSWMLWASPMSLIGTFRLGVLSEPKRRKLCWKELEDLPQALIPEEPLL